jgi:hypothetical protein
MDSKAAPEPAPPYRIDAPRITAQAWAMKIEEDETGEYRLGKKD